MKIITILENVNDLIKNVSAKRTVVPAIAAAATLKNESMPADRCLQVKPCVIH